MLFNISINDPEEGAYGPFLKSAAMTKLGGAANTREDSEIIEKDLKLLAIWEYITEIDPGKHARQYRRIT